MGHSSKSGTKAHFLQDTGIVGGVLTVKSFEREMRYTKAQKTHVNSNCVSILQAGAFFGCFFVWPITAWLGRRAAFMIASAVFCIGAIIQTVNTHSIGAFYAGRVISGLGTGAATVLVPMFSAEMAPKEIRGALGSCFQRFFATGVCISYWVTDAACSGLSSEKSIQWQVPVGLQLVPGALVSLSPHLAGLAVSFLTSVLTLTMTRCLPHAPSDMVSDTAADGARHAPSQGIR